MKTERLRLIGLSRLARLSNVAPRTAKSRLVAAQVQPDAFLVDGENRAASALFCETRVPMLLKTITGPQIVS